VKRYYLRLTESDFVQDGDVWVSPVYDLYENASYTNYSTLKSAYGPDVLGNRTWVGLNYNYSTNESETGRVSNGRYIDKSGRIDIRSYELENIVVAGMESNIDYGFSVYTATEADAATPYQWTENLNLSRNIGVYDSNQYAYFKLEFTDDSDKSDMTFDLLIRVDIARPNIAPLYERSRKILEKFPSWTELYTDSALLATPNSATPSTLGGLFINSMAGEWLEEMDEDVDDLRVDQFITTADTGMVSLVYVVQMPGIDKVWSVVGDGVTLSNCYDLDDFYELDDTEDGYFWTPTEQALYLRKNYTTIEINGSSVYDTTAATPSVFTPATRQIWNWFDEFGLRVDLYRLPEESNESFKSRILDVYINKPGAGREAFKLALRRELDTWQSFGASPDSNYLGATPEIYDLEELRNLVDGASPYMGFDNIPTEKLRSLVQWMSDEYPTTWGHFKWGQALWDVGGEEAEGYSNLPYGFDAASAESLGLEHAGVGDGDDLYVYRPDEYTGPQEFSLNFKARGHQKSTVTGYPGVDVELAIYGTGTYDEYTNPTQTENFCLRVTTASETYHTNFQVSVASNSSKFSLTDTSFVTRSFFEDDGLSREELTWYDLAGNEYSGSEATPFQLAFEDLTNIELVPGEFSAGSTPAFINAPTGNTVRAWFSEDSGPNSVPVGASSLVTDGTMRMGVTGHDGAITSGNAYHAWVAFTYDTATTLSEDSVLIGNTTYNGGAPLWDDGWVLGINASDGLFAFARDGGSNATNTHADAITDGEVHVAFIIVDDSSADLTVSLDGVVETDSGVGFTTVPASHTSIVVGAAVTGSEIDGVTIHGFGGGDTIPTTDEIRGVGAYFGANEGVLEYAYDLFTAEAFLSLNVPEAPYSDEKSVDITDDLAAIDSGDIVLDTNVYNRASMWQYGDTVLAANGIGSATPIISDLVFQSIVSTPTSSTTWTSDQFVENLTINGDHPLTSTKDVTIFPPVDSIFNATVSAIISSPEIVFDLIGDVGSSVDAAGAAASVPAASISIDGNDFGTSDPITLSSAASYTASSTYQTDVTVLTDFEATYSNAVSGTVDINGPWRNGNPPALGNVNQVLENISLTRSNFGIANSADYIVRWIGVEVANNSRVSAWVDANTVLPAVDEGLVGEASSYPSNAILEQESGGTYSYAAFPVKVRIKSGPDKEWNPSVHAGYYYEDDREVYLYANEGNETATPDSDDHILGTVARQGAPIIVKSDDGTELRHVSFWNASTPGISLVHTETVYGSGTNKLYLGYENLYDVTVQDITTGRTVVADTTTATQILTTSQVTERDHQYEVTYKLVNSFIADNTYIYTDGTQRTKLTFDKTPTSAGFGNYEIWYEKNKYNPATPISLPLHPFYTVIDEGFIFLSDNEYDLSDSVEVRFSPSSIVADGNDYIMMSLRTYDIYGNPKPNQDFTLSTDFGSFDYSGATPSSVDITTDRDGFFSIPVLSASSTSGTTGTVTITNGLTGDFTFTIVPSKTPTPTLVAAVTSDRIPADGLSQVYVYGRYTDTDRSPLAGETINWRKGRHIYDMFGLARSSDPATPTSTSFAGEVTTDSDGKFVIGPFTAEEPAYPGYWFVGVEGTYNGGMDYQGDVVFWQEYPDVIYGVEIYSGLPQSSVQDLEWWDIPDYATPLSFPVSYDEATPTYGSTPSSNLIWEPPKWYAIDKYTQYQLNLLGSDYYEYDYTTAQANEHPDYKEL